MLVAGFPAFVESWRLADLLDVAAGTSPTCARDGGNPSDTARVARWSATATGGLRFSPDGRLLAGSSGEHGGLGVWSVATREPLLKMQLPANVWVLGFDPDGRRLAIALQEPRGSQHVVRILAVDDTDLVTVAAQHVTRALTAEECRTFLQAECP